MLLFSLALVAGLVVLVWSAGLFVDGSAATARYFKLPPLLIGMLIIGFGTSAPEIAVSALSSLQGNSDLALGNALGSNITNIALILGITALINPIAVQSRILRKELPILTLVTAITAYLLSDGVLDRHDALILLVMFALFVGWSIWEGVTKSVDEFGEEMEHELEIHEMPVGKSLVLIVAGFVLLLLSSRMLVWGAVGIAQGLGVSNLVIGLTVVAIGTSLPELASSVVAARKGEDDLALGNVIGSNLFNTLVVAGIAGVIHPATVGPVLFHRDVLVMSLLTVSLFVFGYGFRGAGTGRITRLGGAVLVCCYVAYTAYLLLTTIG